MRVDTDYLSTPTDVKSIHVNRGCKNLQEYSFFQPINDDTYAHILCRNFFCGYNYQVELILFLTQPNYHCPICNSRNITIEYVRYNKIVPPTVGLNGKAPNRSFYGAVYFMHYYEEIGGY